MALDPPETYVSVAVVGDETDPGLNSEAGWRPSAATSGPADTASGSGTGDASMREDGEVEDGIPAKAMTSVRTEVKAVENGGGVSKRVKDVVSSGEALGRGGAGNLFVKMCEHLETFEALEKKPEGNTGDSEMAETDEMKNVEEVCEGITVDSVAGGKVVAESDDLFATDVNVVATSVGGSEKAHNAQTQVDSLDARVSSAKRKRSMRYSLEIPEHVDDFSDENVQNGERVSSWQHGEHVEGLFEENVQVGERASSRKKRRPGHLLVDRTEHVGFFHSFQDKKKEKFAVSDLVWGKVRSHPWWPGQIFDASCASKLALDVRKRDQLLVAYFGDKTFAWCDESQLKPFQKYFAQLVKCCSLETFLLAVDEALAETSRRIELGMTCSCLGDDTNASLKEQKIVNAGICEGTFNTVVDRSWVVNSFRPEKLVDYFLTFAQAPYEAADKLECAIANAQVKGCSKGYPDLPIFVLGRGLENDDQESPTNKGKSDKCIPDHTSPVSPDSTSGVKKPSRRGNSLKRQKDVKENSRKDKILFDLIEDNANVDRFGTATEASLNSSVMKQKTFDSSLAEWDISKIKRPAAVGDMDMKIVTKLPKIGEHICRIAGLLTGSPPMLKYNVETIKKSASKASFKKCAATHEPHLKVDKDDPDEETLLQLCLDMKLADFIARKRGKKKFGKLKSHFDSAASN